ncbi:MAG: phosphoribosylaminoimidazolesuccinocarboxamide synthase [Opitutales bacterium]
MVINPWVDRLQALSPEPLFAPPELPYEHLGSGKVRELYAVDGERLLLVATDRISAFDVILPQGIPQKGALLTQLSLYWFAQTRDLVLNHLVPDHDRQLHAVLGDQAEDLGPRCMLVRRLNPVPIEAVVRGYLSGSGWAAYRETGELWGRPLPAGLRQADKLPEPLFTPTTKADAGHDEPLTDEAAREVVGDSTFEAVRAVSLRLYRYGAEASAQAEILLADTKFEFGRDDQGRLVLMDEVLTPDSSRYWPREAWQPGGSPPSFDKQFVRDFLASTGWDKSPPAPDLPDSVVQETAARYREALVRLTRNV